MLARRKAGTVIGHLEQQSACVFPDLQHLTLLLTFHNGLVQATQVAQACFPAAGRLRRELEEELLDRRGDVGAGAVALFRLVHAMAFTDDFSFAIAVSCVSALMLLTRLFPAPIAWLGFATALVHFLSLPAQLLLTGSAGGITGPITVVFALAWLLATALTLVIKLIWEPKLKLAAASADR